MPLSCTINLCYYFIIKKIPNESIKNITTAHCRCVRHEKKKIRKICHQLYGWNGGEKVSTCVYLPIPDWIRSDFITITQQTFGSCLFLFYVCIQWWIFRWAENYCHLVWSCVCFFFRWRIFRSVLLGPTNTVTTKQPPIQISHVERVNLMTAGRGGGG